MENTATASACVLCEQPWDGHGDICESCYENAGDYLMEHARLFKAATEMKDKLIHALDLLEECWPKYYGSSFIAECDDLIKQIDGE